MHDLTRKMETHQRNGSLCAVESDWSNPSVDQAPGIGLEFVSADLRDIIPESTRAFVARPDEKDGHPPEEWEPG